MQILVESIGIGVGMDFIKIADEVLECAENEVEPRLREYGERIVENWNEPPYFVTKSEIIGGDLVISCWPEGPYAQKWVWISEGTGPRDIPATGKKFMAFPSVYTPKTKAWGATVRYGGPGTKSGSWVYTHKVKGHRIKPRNFERAWQNWARFWFPKKIADAIARAKID